MVTVTYSVVPEDLVSSDRESADPLGFRSVANSIARDLVPGLTNSTWLPRGYSLVCLGVDFAQAGDTPARRNDRYLRFERLFVLAAQLKNGDEHPYPGKRVAARLLGQPGERAPLDRALLSRELAGGMWSTYRRSAINLGLLRQVGRGAKPAGHL